MSGQVSHRRFAEKFKEQAVRQVTDRGSSGQRGGEPLGVSTNSLYAWLKRYIRSVLNCGFGKLSLSIPVSVSCFQSR